MGRLINPSSRSRFPLDPPNDPRDTHPTSSSSTTATSQAWNARGLFWSTSLITPEARSILVNASISISLRSSRLNHELETVFPRRARWPDLWGGMRHSVLGRLATPRSGAILTLLVLGIFTPSAAKAGCSAHYLASTPQPGIPLELLSLAGALPTPEDESPRERPTPCSGALCSGNPAPLPTTMPSVPPPGGSQWAVPVASSSPACPGAFARFPHQAIFRPVDRADAIFHPPRVPHPLVTVSRFA
jgi:hypothetical protein